MRRRFLSFRGRRRVNLFLDDLPDYRERRMCFGKRMMNKQQALQTAARMRKELDASDSLVPYRCDFCGRWHVGNDYRRNAA